MTSDARAAGRDARPTVDDLLDDVPVRGKRFQAQVVENRPAEPAADGDSRVEEWVESGPSADYTFLFSA
jgi:hypothetical protein